jgi:hypothetical protein
MTARRQWRHWQRRRLRGRAPARSRLQSWLEGWAFGWAVVGWFVGGPWQYRTTVTVDSTTISQLARSYRSLCIGDRRRAPCKRSPPATGSKQPESAGTLARANGCTRAERRGRRRHCSASPTPASPHGALGKSVTRTHSPTNTTTQRERAHNDNAPASASGTKRGSEEARARPAAHSAPLLRARDRTHRRRAHGSAARCKPRLAAGSTRGAAAGACVGRAPRARAREGAGRRVQESGSAGASCGHLCLSRRHSRARKQRE